ncbi:hypothetical protein EP47_12700 [Legionella norrlandica]|uniref:Uncharacterized protein n=1 Tax=Legionella norrlandica TaxID=1498499 RepID=A0A0A2SS24_9GAMM|nr:hypothetical protein [Legionella norrlandica]KGP62249.1 hypothetical protein EP47_12700 [Legionella norrlandica]
MFTFFKLPQQKKTSPSPFTTQAEVLEKYNLYLNDNGDPVGMCRPMTNAYLSLILRGKNPGEYLANDQRFLELAIKEENKELESRNPDVDHFAFEENNIPHLDKTVEKSSLKKETLSKLLEDSQHLLITYPQKKFEHEFYLGKKMDGNCRFFDANITGGERNGPCDELISNIVEIMKSRYTEENKPFRIGMS